LTFKKNTILNFLQYTSREQTLTNFEIKEFGNCSANLRVLFGVSVTIQ